MELNRESIDQAFSFAPSLATLDEMRERVKEAVLVTIRERVKVLLVNTTPNRLAALVLILEDDGQPIGELGTAE